VISFRFHLLSLVAAFLALAVGIVIGTTLADRAIVDGLRNRVDTVSANLDERQAANDRLQAENDRLRSFLDDSGGRLVVDELVDQPVVVLTEQGVDGDAVDRTVDLLGEAGASVRSQVEIKAEWELDTPEARADLATALDIPDEDAATMRSSLSRLLISDLASPVVVPDDENGVIDTAVAQGLISYDEVDDVVLDPQQTMTFVLVTGTTGVVESAVDDLALAAEAEGSPTVATEVFDQAAADSSGTERGESLLTLRSDSVLDAAIATVDDLDLVQGRLAAILALADAIEGLVGHYGYGPDVDGAAPEVAIP
jgi:PAS domain-containing protein